MFKPQKKPRTKPTFKQKMFAKEYIKNNGNGAQAAMKAYDTDAMSAKGIAYQNINKPVVQEEIQQQLRKAGITEDFLHEKLLKSIEAGEGVKATQKDSNNMIQFAYKLHNMLPANKSMKLSMNLSGEVTHKNIDELTEAASKLTDTTQSLLQIFKKKG